MGPYGQISGRVSAMKVSSKLIMSGNEGFALSAFVENCRGEVGNPLHVNLVLMLVNQR